MAYEIAIIGGGFYGCAIGLHLRRRGYSRIILVERESQLLTRASYSNQARIHNGYHYPRSYLTAYRSRVNLPRFCRDYGFAVYTDFVMLYAIAAKRSKVIPQQFERFMRDIGAKYETAGSGYASLFDKTEIAATYIVEEYAFDACKIQEHFHREIPAAGITLILGSECTSVEREAYNGRLKLLLRSPDSISHIETETVLNCTYSALNRISPGAHATTPLKHETAELALVDVPSSMARLGVTVMDGPFFSCMPFPAERCHSLSHVRYTPCESFIDQDGRPDPAKERHNGVQTSRANYMIADAARLMPCMRFARLRKSLFETKTVLVHNESDDGRPILLRRETLHPRFFSILGAKVDNIYDVLLRLDRALDQPIQNTAGLADHSASNQCPHGDFRLANERERPNCPYLVNDSDFVK